MHPLRAALLTFLLVLAACAPATPQPTAAPTPPPVWSPPVVIAQAQQADAPVLWTRPEGVIASWVGADDAGVHQDARFIGDTPAPVTVLPLPPEHPYAQQAGAARNGNLHLLWLDSGEGGDGNRVFSAVLSPELTVKRGPTAVSNLRTLHYSLAPAGDGGLWVAWSGGILSEPSIYVQYVDPEGRPREPLLAAISGVWPALARANEGSIFLFWLDNETGSLRRARLQDGQAVEQVRLDVGVHLQAGERHTGLYAAFDGALAYVFWHITRADGSRATGYAWGELTETDWSQRMLAEGEWAWATPLAGQHDPLPVIADAGGVIVGYLSGGEIVDVEQVAPLESRLIGTPGLYADSGGRLYAVWAAPTAQGYAELKLSVREAR